MAVCTFDNPSSMSRECWQNGKLLCAYSCRLFPPFAKTPIPGEYLFFGANIGPWKDGQAVGDKEAIGE